MGVPFTNWVSIGNLALFVLAGMVTSGYFDSKVITGERDNHASFRSGGLVSAAIPEIASPPDRHLGNQCQHALRAAGVHQRRHTFRKRPIQRIP